MILKVKCTKAHEGHVVMGSEWGTAS